MQFSIAPPERWFAAAIASAPVVVNWHVVGHFIGIDRDVAETICTVRILIVEGSPSLVSGFVDLAPVSFEALY